MIRFFDIILSIIGILVLFPLLFVISIVIYIDNPGSIFYFQNRVGQYGIAFKLIKFRTMFAKSDKQGLITIGNRDGRITPVGYWLRRYKLDELPQLINILKGDMSMVGPRPEVPCYVDCYTDKQRVVLTIPPGMTDYASIVFRGENEILEKVANPEDYYIKMIIPWKIRLNMIFINNRSLCLYFVIMFITIFKVLSTSRKKLQK